MLILAVLFLKADEGLYPEFYRKSLDVKESNVEVPEPFRIGLITSIYTTSAEKMIPSSDIWLKVRKFYRPENTHDGVSASFQADLNMLYWSEEGKFHKTVHFLILNGKGVFRKRLKLDGIRNKFASNFEFHHRIVL